MSDKENKPVGDKKVPYLSLYRYADRKDILILVIGMLCAAANGAMMPLMTIVFGNMNTAIVDYLQSTRDSVHRSLYNTDVIHYTLLFVYLGIAAFAFSYVSMAFFMWSGERQTRKTRSFYFRAIMAQEIPWFDANPTGELAARVSSDTLLIQEGISEKVGLVIQYLVTFVTGFVIAFIRCWQLALVLTAVIPCLAGCGLVISKFTARRSAGSQAGYAAAGAVAQEVLSSIRTVVAFGGERAEAKRYSERIAKGRRENERIALISGLGFGTIMLIIFCAYGLAFWFGSTLLANGTINEAGIVLNVFFALVIGAFSLGHAGPHFASFGIACGAAVQIFALIDAAQLQKANAGADADAEAGAATTIATAVDLKGCSVHFRSVGFHYPHRPDVAVLANVTLTLPAGKTTAIVGPSGSGKSTLTQLLLGFYRPSSGNILIGERSLAQLGSRYRGQIAIVSQEPVLFDTSIAANVALGSALNPDQVTREDIVAACKLANAHYFIQALPKGYDTVVGDRGCLLSGGQKQRIAIARAIIKNPSILILDEATSALDSESESLIQEALERLSHNRTTLVIAHRLSTIRHADLVAVLHGGTIVESGTHDSLSENSSSLYAELVAAQSLGSTSSSMASTRSDSALGQTNMAVRHGDTAKDTEEKQEKVHAASLSQDAGTLEKSSSTPLSSPSMTSIVKRVFAMNHPEAKFMLVGLLAAIGNGAMMPLFSLIFSEIQSAFANPDMAEVQKTANLYSIFFVALGVFSFVAHLGQFFMLGKSGERLTARLRVAVFESILRQNIGWFDEAENNPGTLASNLASEAEEVKGLSGQLVGTILQMLVNMMAGLVIAFINGWQLTLVVLATIPMMMLAGVFQMKALNGFGGRAKAAYSISGKIASEAIQNIRTLASLERQAYFVTTYNDSLHAPYLASLRKAFLASIGFGLSQAMMFWSYAICYIYGTRLILWGTYDFGQMNRVLFSILFSAMSAGQIASFAPSMSKAKVAATRIFKILDRMSTIDAVNPGKMPPCAPAERLGAISFSNVRFSYPTRPTCRVFEGLDFRVEPGQTVALVGPSGSGKSSIIGLLERFYDVNQGSVLLDGVDLRDWPPAHLRSRLGLVTQEPTLFHKSIFDNIAYGKPDATCAEVEAAAKQANAHDFIVALPEGYQTNVGEKGAQISGGQKQRIAIARAMVRQPEILLLDEATSALDTESESIVSKALDAARQGRTCIMIAHRLSTVQNANVIYVLDHGAIVEKGTHAELLAQGGIYALLSRKQRLDVRS